MFPISTYSPVLQERSMASDLFLNAGLLFQSPSYKKCDFQHVLLTKVSGSHTRKACTIVGMHHCDAS
jgi:hypothetical protein